MGVVNKRVGTVGGVKGHVDVVKKHVGGSRHLHPCDSAAGVENWGAMAVPARRFTGVLCALLLIVMNGPGSILAGDSTNTSSSTTQAIDSTTSTSSIFTTSNDTQTLSTRVTTVGESSPTTIGESSPTTVGESSPTTTEWYSSTSVEKSSTPEMNTSSTTSSLASTSATTFLVSAPANVTDNSTTEGPVNYMSSTTSPEGLSSSSSGIAWSTGFSTSVGTSLSASTWLLTTTGIEQALTPEPLGTLSAGVVIVIIAFCVLGLIVLLGLAVYYIRSKRGPEFERLQDDVPMGHVQEGMPFAHLEK
uniref:uncharacterized protein n=1 Tax=Myxine glutinosa TaxID=7769 RepID=UPI00358F5769